MSGIHGHLRIKPGRQAGWRALQPCRLKPRVCIIQLCRQLSNLCAKALILGLQAGYIHTSSSAKKSAQVVYSISRSLWFFVE